MPMDLDRSGSCLLSEIIINIAVILAHFLLFMKLLMTTKVKIWDLKESRLEGCLSNDWHVEHGEQRWLAAISRAEGDDTPDPTPDQTFQIQLLGSK